MMRKLAIASLLFSQLAWGAPSAAEVERALGGYEHAPTAEDIRRLGPGADQTLIAVAEDARTSRLRRARAVGALRFVPSAGAHAFLRALIDDKGHAPRGADVLDVAAALAALAPYGRDELPLEVSYLGHASAELRQASAAALGQILDAEAIAPLRARLAVERDVGVRLTLARSLKAIEAPR